MSYHLDFSQLDLDFLKRRLLQEDLIPSHLSCMRVRPFPHSMGQPPLCKIAP